MTITKNDFFYVRNHKTVFVIAKPKGVNGDLPLLEKSKLDNALDYIRSEVTSYCHGCKTEWNGMITKCETCGGEYIENDLDYKSKIEYIVGWDMILEAFPYLQDEEQKK